MCVCARARARVRACVRACASHRSHELRRCAPPPVVVRRLAQPMLPHAALGIVGSGSVGAQTSAVGVRRHDSRAAQRRTAQCRDSVALSRVRCAITVCTGDGRDVTCLEVGGVCMCVGRGEGGRGRTRRQRYVPHLVPRRPDRGSRHQWWYPTHHHSPASWMGPPGGGAGDKPSEDGEAVGGGSARGKGAAEPVDGRGVCARVGKGHTCVRTGAWLALIPRSA